LTTYKLAFHDTDIIADIFARIVASISVSASWNASYTDGDPAAYKPKTNGQTPTTEIVGINV